MNTNSPNFLCTQCNIIFPDYELYMQHEAMCCCDQQQLSLHQRVSISNSMVVTHRVQRVVPNRMARQFVPYPTQRVLQANQGRNLESFRGSQNPTCFSRPVMNNGGKFVVTNPNQQTVRAAGDGDQRGNGRVNDATLTTRDFLSILVSNLERQTLPNSDASDETELDLELHL